MKVLLATDGSRDADVAADFLTRFQWTDADSAIVLTVVPDYVMLTGRIDAQLRMEAWRRELVDEETRAADDIANRAAEKLRSCFRSVETRIHAGQPYHEILNAADEEKADLIALGKRGRSGLEEWFLGSVCRSVVERSQIPVLMARPDDGSLDRVVVGYNGSPQSASAVEWASRLPFPPGVEVRLVGVVEPVPMPAAGPGILMPIDYGSVAAQLEQGRERIMREELAGIVERLAPTGIAVHEEVRNGNAAAEICSVAAGMKADLILLGGHAHGGWIQDWLGNTARGVALRAPCAVLVVRQPPSTG